MMPRYRYDERDAASTRYADTDMPERHEHA